MENASFILDIAYQWSYLGVFVIALIANAFPGIPEEVFILALGYLGSTGNFNMFAIGIVAFLGMFTSDCIIFTISRSGVRFYQMIAKRLLGEEEMQEVSKSSFTKRHINKIIFFSRFVVQVRFLGPFLAGVHKIPWKQFLTYNTAALFIYIPLALFLGSYFQGRIERILSGSSIVGNYLLIFVAMLALIFVVRMIRKGFLKKLLAYKSSEKVKSFLGFSKVEEDK